MPSRVLYSAQSLNITTNGGYSRYLPVQSANCDITNPNEDILSFGQLGSLGKFQTNVSTCKSSIKSYLPLPAQGASWSGDATGGGGEINVVDATLLSALTGEALGGLVSTITVQPNGFIMSGILTSFGVDISNGGFAMADFGFNGVGVPNFAPQPVGNTYAIPGNMPSSFTPVVSSHVSGLYQAGGGTSITGNTASSFKFNLDIPTDQLSSLGGAITGGQVVVAPYFLMVAKPPFKTSISVEGTSIAIPAGTGAAGNMYVVGTLGITLPKALVTASSFNQAVGNIGASYNYSLEDTSVVFTDLTNSYPY